MNVEERFHVVPMSADSSTVVHKGLAGFICTTSGTLTITDSDSAVLVNALPVTAGVTHPLPIHFKSASTGATVQLAGGAVGALLV